MVAGRGVYQPSVADTRIYAQIYMQSASYSRDALPPALSLAPRPFGPSPDLALERARAFNPPRPYNSNVGNPFDWYSHTRYYFYTCDTASVSGDKGNECMTARIGASCVGWSTKFALQFRRNQRVIFCFFLSCRSLFFVNLLTG